MIYIHIDLYTHINVFILLQAILSVELDGRVVKSISYAISPKIQEKLKGTSYNFVLKTTAKIDYFK